MRILIENSSNQLENLGDVAMLQVCIERLKRAWPEAELVVIAENPQRLSQLFPTARALAIPQPSWWKHVKRLTWSWLPDRAQAAASALELYMRRLRTVRQRDELHGAIARADLVVHSGAGVFADPFLPGALRRLQLLEHAGQLGKPTALFSQGIGPLEDPRLKQVAARVLPNVGRIAAREGRHTPQELTALGVDRDRISVTGDDAIEVGWRAAPLARGSDLGLNLRLAPYSGLSPRRGETLGELARSLVAASSDHSAALRPIIIDPEDKRAVEHAFASKTGVDLAPAHQPRMPELLRSLGRCRLVVSGSYHGAALALSQGIPAIGVYASEYYRRKFTGLAGMFDGLLPTVDLRKPGFGEVLTEAIGEAMEAPTNLRERLLSEAADQVGASKKAYQEFQIAMRDRGRAGRMV